MQERKQAQQEKLLQELQNNAADERHVAQQQACDAMARHSAQSAVERSQLHSIMQSMHNQLAKDRVEREKTLRSDMQRYAEAQLRIEDLEHKLKMKQSSLNLVLPQFNSGEHLVQTRGNPQSMGQFDTFIQIFF